MFRCVFLSSLLFFSSCTDQQSKQQKEDATASKDLVRTALQMEPVLNEGDKVEAIFYDDPDGDSLRYARFFRFVSTGDTAVIQALKRNLEGTVSQYNTVKPCRSEGKLQLLKKDEALKTIYFSTRCDSCCYLYFIKDGSFYYTPITSPMRQVLQSLKEQAHKP